MGKRKKNSNRNVGFYLTLTVSVLLVIGGFFVPPMGVIDGSVLQAVGLLLAFGSVSMLPDIIRSSKHAKITTGSTTIEVSRKAAQECEVKND